MKANLLLIVALLLSWYSFPLPASDYYVSPTGNDSNAGTLDSPWKTIQHAANSVSPGDTVFIRGGTYSELLNISVSGSSSGGYITFRNFVGETPVIDGSALTPGNDASALVKIEDRKYVTIEGLEICNYITSDASSVPIGIYVNNTGDHINILNCTVHNIEQKSEATGNAHGIAVYARNGSKSIKNLTISGNTVRNCKLGWSESMVLNGNVELFTVSDNTIHDNDNIGIDLIGWEGTAPANDQARNGTVSGNTIYNITSSGNPAYGNERSAGGIYVDGGKDIIIERNAIYKCDIGVEVGCEHNGKTVENITVRDNLIYQNNVTGLGFGGYASNRGIILNSRFEHNTFFRNDTTASGTGEIMIQKAHDNTIEDNIICASSQNIIFTNYFSSSDTYNNTFDYNLYYSPGGAANCTFVWQNTEYTGFANFQAGSSQEANSAFSNPLFVDPESDPPNLHLQPASPAINAGNPNFVPGPGEADFDGNRRVIGGRDDCGAYEYNPGVPATLAMALDPVGSGTTDPSTGAHAITTETMISITATASSGYLFKSWSATSDATVTDANSATTTVSLSGDATITANFALIPPQATLTMAVSPSGTTVPSEGAHVVATQVAQNISAVPAEGYVFSTWSVAGPATIEDETSADTTVTILGDTTVTANFAVNSFYLALGSITVVNAQDVRIQNFEKKPKIFGIIGGVNCAMSIIDKINKNNQPSSVRAEWRKKIVIYDKSVYKKSVLLSTLLNNSPIANMEVDGGIVVDASGDETILQGTYYIADPQISDVTGNHSATDDQFTVKGMYYGYRPPSIYLEYLKNADPTKPGYKKCKLAKELSYKYKDAKEKAGKSCMKIYSNDIGVESVGYSEITVLYPKISAKDTATGYIILDNGMGLAAYKINP